MKKEVIEKIVEEFDENIKERAELVCRIQSNELALDAIMENQAVKTYIYIKENLEEAKEKIERTTDDIGDFAMQRTYKASKEEPYVWINDYYSNIDDGHLINTYREDPEGTHRVYLGMESLIPKDLTKEAARAFEIVNDVIILEEYNNPQDLGITPEIFNDLRKEYFKEILGKQKIKK